MNELSGLDWLKREWVSTKRVVRRNFVITEYATKVLNLHIVPIYISIVSIKDNGTVLYML